MRRKSPSLRGSVTQTTNAVRVRDKPRLSFLARWTLVAGVCLIFGLLGLWGWKSGWMHRQTERLADAALHVTQEAHFSVNDIIVEGRNYTDKTELLAALGVASGSPILAFNPTEASARIAKLPWVSAVVVERRLPETIYVRLTEREPLARWQHENLVTVIDTEGHPLSEAVAAQFTQLPLLVGAGAPAEAKAFLDMLNTFPMVTQHMTSAVRVSERRWDIHLQPNIVARLPETGISDALKRLSLLISEQKILERDIVAIDLRMPDRLIIESPSAPSSQHPAQGDHPL